MEKRGINTTLFFVLVFVLVGSVAAESFEIDNILIKVSLHKGDVTSKSVSFSTTEAGEVRISVENVPGLTLSETLLTVQKNEQKLVTASFDSTSLNPGVYVGSIKISSEKETSYLPVIFEVESNDVFFDANLDIPPHYSEVAPGEKLLAQIKIFDLSSGGTATGLGASKIEVFYNIYGLDGKVISSESENVVVDRQTQFTKTVTFPEDISEGQYVFSTLLKSNSSVGIATQTFSIKKPAGGILGGLFDLRFFSVLAIIFISFAALIFLFLYILRDRDKLIIEMKKFNSEDLERQKQLLLQQEKILKEKGTVDSAKIERDVADKLELIQKKHEQKVKELRKLKDDGDVKEMEKKLEQWKKEGYNTLGLEYKLKGLDSKEMKRLLKQWKGKYNRRV